MTNDYNYKGYHKPLTTEEERECVIRAKYNDPIARNKLVHSIMPLIIDLAIKLSRYTTLEVGDLISEGVLGAVTAIEKYDLDNGKARFHTYAMTKFSYVRRAMDVAMEGQHQIKRSVKEKTQVAKKKSMLEEYAEQVIETKVHSMDTPLGDDSRETIGDSLSSNTEEKWGLTSIPMSEGNISDYLETLPEYERKMMLLFASGETTREVGSQFDISHQTAINRVHKSIANIREELYHDGLIDEEAYDEEIKVSFSKSKALSNV